MTFNQDKHNVLKKEFLINIKLINNFAILYYYNV